MGRKRKRHGFTTTTASTTLSSQEKQVMDNNAVVVNSMSNSLETSATEISNVREADVIERTTTTTETIIPDVLAITTAPKYFSEVTTTGSETAPVHPSSIHRHPTKNRNNNNNKKHKKLGHHHGRQKNFQHPIYWIENCQDLIPDIVRTSTPTTPIPPSQIVGVDNSSSSNSNSNDNNNNNKNNNHQHHDLNDGGIDLTVYVTSAELVDDPISPRPKQHQGHPR